MRGFGFVGIAVVFLCPMVSWSASKPSPTKVSANLSTKQKTSSPRKLSSRRWGRNAECRAYFAHPAAIPSYASSPVNISALLNRLREQLPQSPSEPLLINTSISSTECLLTGCPPTLSPTLSLFQVRSVGSLSFTGCGLDDFCSPALLETNPILAILLNTLRMNSPQKPNQEDLVRSSLEELQNALLYAQEQGWSVTAETGFQRGVPTPIYVAHVNEDTSMEIRTAVAFHQMQQQARAHGVTLVVNSGFRTMLQQKEAYHDYCFDGGPLAARPGNSNHQLGYALDIDVKRKYVFSWLTKKAKEHGFNRSVPSEKWHWERLPDNDLALLAYSQMIASTTPQKRAAARKPTSPVRASKPTERSRLQRVVQLPPPAPKSNRNRRS